MTRWDDNHLPDDLADVARRLRTERPEASALELDQIKQRAMARAGSSRQKGFLVKSRLTVALLTLGLMAGGTGGVLAAAGGNGNGNGNNAAGSQYKPGRGCGDKNHIHTGPPGNPNKNPATDCPKGSAQNP